MNVDLTIYLTKEGRHYVAQAMPLDVVSSGPTPEAARDAVYEAVRAFLLTAADQGTLEEVLEECGYTSNTATAPPPRPSRRALRCGPRNPFQRW